MKALIPSWGQISEWKESNWSVDYHLKKYADQVSLLTEAAREIRKNLELIFPVQNALCNETCRFCPDPCCLNATVWLDMKDILFMHLIKQPIPERQLIEKQGDSCIYHGRRGCCLPRLSRPFTCILYLCPPQLAKFGLLDSDAKEAYNNQVNLIKAGRKEIEEMYIGMISSSKNRKNLFLVGGANDGYT